MPALTTVQRRAHYDDFVAQVIDQCTENSIRADLASGRGRPWAECDRMQPHLIRLIAGYGARRAHSTIACLIAMQRRLTDDSPYPPESASDDPSADADGTARPSSTAVDTATAAPTHEGAPPGNPAAKEATPGLLWRKRPNLGASLAIAVVRHGFDEERMTERLKALTKLPSELLHPRLWSLASYLRNQGAARLDFAVLLEDLAWWDNDQPEIATRWRESYFPTIDHLRLSEEH
ncbi:type I-E CRISPR-associated protein Cse2/CasB [Streptomyces sp. NBC_01707]|uniref:type I-E CRISPR-associated protein Cse2/CasB n=1 Tax=unclassified Streptomyces TaxID=2593676 RepID=UPI0029B756EB|nr:MULTISPECIES: type I-E CRISPR-associated protein Cse2/CasB [unclassified Streptomyces]MDX3771650.1 type I-E CRISPR-associated protein Cse2/CasB [Streptomyces sp. AK08-01B]MDX3821287.1 type I-E CRISPR-associated protein Cse2/CasB [Streptomyces sp. AK08-01A]